MYRLRLTTGEEAVYRTVEELALGIQSGTVTGDAQFFAADAAQWIPITAAPEYEAAIERAATLTDPEEFNPELDEPGLASPAPTPVPAAPEGEPHPVQIYQMFSRSAAELAARKRPSWALRVGTATAVLLCAAAVGLTYRAYRESPSVGEKGATVRASRSRPPSANAEAAPVVRMAPYNLVARLNDATRSRTRSFSDSVSHLGLRGLLDPGVLNSTSEARKRRESLNAYLPLLNEYRAAQRATEAAYRDTAAALARAGTWSRAETQEWQLRMLPVERAADVAVADSLLEGLIQLYTLLEAQEGQYQLTPTNARFAAPEAGQEYDRLRRLISHLAPVMGPPPDRSPPPLAILLVGIGQGSLPARHNP